MESLRGEVYRRELQPYLTDHQWRHAVSEALRGGNWFPSIYELADLAKGAPAPEAHGLLTAGPECPLCSGTGFETGDSFARQCPHGCKPRRASEGFQPIHRADPMAMTALERVRLICRQQVRAGRKEFRYPGIDADIDAEIAAEEKEAVKA